MRLNLRIAIYLLIMIILFSHCNTKKNDNVISFEFTVSNLKLETDSVKSKMYLSYESRKVKQENLQYDKNTEVFYATVNSAGAYIDSLMLMIPSSAASNTKNEILDIKSILGNNAADSIERLIQKVSDSALNILQNEDCRAMLSSTINSVINKHEDLTLESIFESNNREIVILTLWAFKLAIYKIGYLALNENCK